MKEKPFIKRLLKCDGYTLVELIVVIGIIGLLAAVMALTFNVVTRVSTTARGQNIVFSQVHTAGNWISKDVESADNVTAGSTGNWKCSIQRYNWNGVDNITTIQIDYNISNGVMTRSVNGGQGQFIAQYISNPGTDTTFMASTENNTYLLTVKSVYSKSSYQCVFKINQITP